MYTMYNIAPFRVNLYHELINIYIYIYITLAFPLDIYIT